MFRSLSAEHKQAGKEKIEQQRSSGQPITHWCKENGISIGQFYYWKEQFFPRLVQRSEFLELKSSQKTGIRVECNTILKK